MYFYRGNIRVDQKLYHQIPKISHTNKKAVLIYIVGKSRIFADVHFRSAHCNVLSQQKVAEVN